MNRPCSVQKLWELFIQQSKCRSGIEVYQSFCLKMKISLIQWTKKQFLRRHFPFKGFYELRRSSCYSLKTRVQQCSNSLVQHVINSDARWHSPLWQKWEWLLSVPHRRWTVGWGEWSENGITCMEICSSAIKLWQESHQNCMRMGPNLFNMLYQF